MQKLGWSISLVLFLVLGVTTAAPAADAPVRAKVIVQRTEIGPDGLATRTVHSELQPTNAAAAARVGQMPIRFNELLEDVEILEAYTAKPDGRKIPVDLGAIQTQLVPGTPPLPLFTDQKQKVVLFRDVEAGDTVVARYVRRQKSALFPGHFTDSFAFTPPDAVDDFRLTYVAPRELPLFVANHEAPHEKTESGNQVQYEWRFSARAPVEDATALSAFDRRPRFFVTTFKDYDALASGYAALVAPKMAVTPAVQALADRLTAGTPDRRQQAQKLYDHVSTRIRYVALALGAGAIVPRDVDTILTDGYGDCKDKAVLLSALLRAKGMASELVIINLGNSYAAPPVATLAPFNHVVLFIPELNLYADSTTGVAPFGTLPLELYGKPAIHAVTTGSALKSTPLLPPAGTSVALKTIQTLSEDGKISGTTSVSATGPLGVRLRQQARAIQAGGVDRWIPARTMGEGRGTMDMPPPEQPGDEYGLVIRFEHPAPPAILRGDSVALGTNFWLISRPGGVLMGLIQARNLDDEEPTPCFSGFESEEIVLNFPASRRVTALPKDTEIMTANLRYATRWSMNDTSVTVYREFRTRIDQPLCTGQVRKDTAAALEKIREDLGARVTIASR